MPTPDIAEEWQDHGAGYRTTVASGPSSSSWLRDVVLKPEIIRLLGNRSGERVLDAGTGSGWLFDAVDIGERHACDIARPESVRPDVAFVEANISDLPYPDRHFDAIVASIVLCYCGDLTAVVHELHRVTQPGGTLVVALVHPYFYRTGEALEDDRFVVEADLSQPGRFDIVIGGTAGPFTYYRYSIPDYINALVRHGWQLEETTELFVPRAEYQSRFQANDLVRRSTRVPLFVTFRFKQI
ncbi:MULTISPECIES: class I SAM-dependent methyltransferase [unclassified Mesorhizobium]|uniref:class I SAM-dependent methyltransferase n=1 Tax=unclassified Mesorhizobium TaxID=325217 RepID=UPI00333B53D7